MHAKHECVLRLRFASHGEAWRSKWRSNNFSKQCPIFLPTYLNDQYFCLGLGLLFAHFGTLLTFGSSLWSLLTLGLFSLLTSSICSQIFSPDEAKWRSKFCFASNIVLRLRFASRASLRLYVRRVSHVTSRVLFSESQILKKKENTDILVSDLLILHPFL